MGIDWPTESDKEQDEAELAIVNRLIAERDAIARNLYDQTEANIKLRAQLAAAEKAKATGIDRAVMENLHITIDMLRAQLAAAKELLKGQCWRCHQTEPLKFWGGV